jgi:HK97 family phage prohead protease
MTIEVPRDDLFRGIAVKPEVRADADPADSSLMHGHFAVFNRWTEIDSWFEGRFLERIAPGAFKKTFREQRESVKVQFDHGFDVYVGDAPLGPIDDLREDDEGAYYEVPLLDTDYNRDRVLPMLQGRLMNGEQRGSVLGASFRFRVVADEWNSEPEKSDGNPDGLPERTIKEVRLYEFGPVVFPAYEEATAGVRSLTDHFLQRRIARQGGAERAARHLAPAAPSTEAEPTVEPARSHSTDKRSVLLAAAQTEILKLQRRAS